MRPGNPSGEVPILHDSLISHEVERALAGLPDGVDVLRSITILGRSLAPDLARRAASLHELRTRARRRFPTLYLPYLHAKGLEQASAELVARSRARRIAAQRPGARLLDATCSIGADALACALEGLSVVGADVDAESLTFARANFRYHNALGQFVRADAATPAVRAELYLVDPDRRVDGQRSLDPAAWSPTLAESLATATRFEGACLKLAPALDIERLRSAEAAALPESLPREREWLSREGELAEVCLWTGALAPEAIGADQRVATRIDSAGASHRLAGSPIERAAMSPQEAESAAFLADPDPAVIRSGLLGLLAEQEGLRPLAPQLGYLGGDRPSRSPFLRVFRVLGSTPLDRKRVRRMLREHEIGPVSVRKRGHQERAEVLARRLRGDGPRRGELIVARLDSGHRVYLVEPVVGDEGLEPPTSSL